MLIKTKYHGEIDIREDDILTFEKGIPGFLEEKEFIVLPLSEDQSFSIMQSVSTEYLAFVIANPFYYFRDYDFQLEDPILEELEMKSEQEVQVYSILTVEEPFEQTTANLQAPVIINIMNHKAKQVILNNGNYKSKHPIFKKG
jgi:flagellar assembly factor FliW